MKDASAPGAATSPPTRRSAFRIRPNGRRSWARMAQWLGVALISFTLLVGAAIPAAAAELMRVTFVRHGQSAGNASGLIDTSTPGPVLTQTGQAQAQAVVGRLGVNNYDGIYSSTMVRTQLTAAAEATTMWQGSVSGTPPGASRTAVLRRRTSPGPPPQ